MAEIIEETEHKDEQILIERFKQLRKRVMVMSIAVTIISAAFGFTGVIFIRKYLLTLESL